MLTNLFFVNNAEFAMLEIRVLSLTSGRSGIEMVSMTISMPDHPESASGAETSTDSQIYSGLVLPEGGACHFG